MKKQIKGYPIERVYDECRKRKNCKGCPYEHAFGGCSSTVMQKEKEEK